METKKEQLREIVKTDIDSLKNLGVSKNIRERELYFIERRGMEDYFLVAHQFMNELKKNEAILIGPGWDWMISSHVCRSLGITNICPRDVSMDPILVWGDDKSKPTISIEVDEDSFHIVLRKAIIFFGYDNIAKMPVNSNGLRSCALLFCNDGIANHFQSEEMTDQDGYKILCTKEYIKECDNRSVFRFNILQSTILSSIKRIQELIVSNGKEAPKLYENWIWNENYRLFHDGELSDIPLFNCKSIQRMTKMLMAKQQFGSFNELLNIQGLLSSREGHTLCDEEAIVEYQHEHGIGTIMGETRYPWGFLFREDVAWVLRYWVGLSWRQTAHVMLLADAKLEREAEVLKHIYLQQGMNNGFNEAELNRIWNSLFKRRTQKALPSKAHYSGRVYLSVFLARLKNEFPKEFNMIQYGFKSQTKIMHYGKNIERTC